MPISGINSFPLLPAGPQRGSAEPAAVERERAEKDRFDRADIEERRSTEPSSSESGTLQPEALELSAQQRVVSSNRDEDTRFTARAEQEGLNFSTQRALQAFADNTPSPEQRLGIELAGIDTFA